MQEEIELFLDAYKEKMISLKRDHVDYKEAKKLAFKYALTVVPELKQPWLNFKGRSYKNGPLSPEHKIGHLMAVKIGALVKLNKFNTTWSEQKERKTDISNLFKEWVEKNDFIPDDTIMAHFSPQVTFNAFSSVRYRLIREGWEFEKVEHGWKVIKRLSDEKTQRIDELTKLVQGALKELEGLKKK